MADFTLFLDFSASVLVVFFVRSQMMVLPYFEYSVYQADSDGLKHILPTHCSDLGRFHSVTQAQRNGTDSLLSSSKQTGNWVSHSEYPSLQLSFRLMESAPTPFASQSTQLFGP